MRKQLWTLLPVIIALGAGGDPCPAQSQGPDVIVGDLHNAASYPPSEGGISAFAVGTFSCNIGNQPLLWIANTNQHPVIGQNAFRLKNGRFEQIGMSWLKHGFYALSLNLCGTCTVPSDGTRLNPGCADPYDAGLNGSQFGLGPRFEVNAATGYFPYPPSNPVWTGMIARRLQIRNADIDPAQNQGAIYFVDGQYVSPDDAAAGNKHNNASYRPASFSNVGGQYYLNLSGTTQRTRPAIQAWQDTDPTVQLRNIDITGDGRLILAWKATELSAGMWHYEYALQNLNSDRCAQSFTIQFPTSATVSNIGFHDVDHHSGEPLAITDWVYSTVFPGFLTWSTQTYSQNVSANALRWGTLFNFRFDSDARPETVNTVQIGLFKPGTPTSLTVAAPMAYLGAPGTGTVGANIVKLNGSSGGAWRRVDVAPNQPITLLIEAPPGFPGVQGATLFGIVGAPAVSEAQPLGSIGTMAFRPCPLGPSPISFTFMDYLNIGTCGAFFTGSGLPWTVTHTPGLPEGTFLTLQGVMTSPVAPFLRVTNGVILRVSATL